MSTLSAPYVLEYSYKRSEGPVIGRFLASLKEARIEGVKTADGRVIVPAQAYDPETGASLGDEWADVGPEGEVVSWCYVMEPRETHPLARPFAFALIKLDGASTALLHAIDAPISALKKGLRVAPRWRDERQGHILDIECFEPVGGAS